VEHQLDEGLPHVRAVELIAGDGTAVLGVRADELREIGDVPLAGQVFNVFRLRDGRIVGIQDYATRREALDAPAARDPDWA
jgi:limonene-1,2-epoxide hydrolase